MSTSENRVLSNDAVTAGSYHDVIRRFYLAYFGRPADVAGLDYWSVQYLQRSFPASVSGFTDAYAGDAAIRAFVDFYGASKESTELYAGDNGAFIGAVYRNLFNREPEADGRAFWLDKLERNVMTRPVAAFQIMRGARGLDLDIIEKKVAVAKRFTAALDTDRKRAAYDGMAANASVRAMLGAVGSSTDAPTFALVATLESLEAQLGAPRQYLTFMYGSRSNQMLGLLPAEGGASVQVPWSGFSIDSNRLHSDTVQTNPAQHVGRPSISYWHNKRLYRQSLVGYGNVPQPVIVSALTEDEVCTTPTVFDDHADDAKSYRLFQRRTASGGCLDDEAGLVAVRMNMASTALPPLVKRPLFATRTASGAISGFLVQDKLEVKRVDAQFGNARAAFTLPAPDVAAPDTVHPLRRVGNLFFFRSMEEIYLWDADSATAREPLRLTDRYLGQTFGDALMADGQSVYLARQSGPDVTIDSYRAATHSTQLVGKLPFSAYTASTLNLTARYFVVGDTANNALWVLPLSEPGAVARKLYQGAQTVRRELRVRVAGERIWFATNSGVAAINTDGGDLVEYAGALLPGCVYRPGAAISGDNDVCASMLILQDNTLRGYNASTGALEVTYGVATRSTASVEHIVTVSANAGAGVPGQGMLLTRTATAFIPNETVSREHWHFIAGAPGLTRLVTP